MTLTFSRDEIERHVLDQYYKVAGKVVLAHEVVCIDEDRQEVTVMCDPPAILRAEHSYPGDTLLRWNSGHSLEPIYDVSVLEPHRAFAFVRPSYVLGTCVSTKKGEFRHARFEVADPGMQERYRNARGLDKDEIGACSPPQLPMP